MYIDVQTDKRTLKSLHKTVSKANISKLECLLYPGVFNRSTQHFSLYWKDGVFRWSEDKGYILRVNRSLRYGIAGNGCWRLFLWFAVSVETRFQWEHQSIAQAVPSQSALNKTTRQLNERPRKTMKFETPAERLNACVASISWGCNPTRTFFALA